MKGIRDLWERLLDNPQIGGFLRENQNTLKRIGIVAGIAIVLFVAWGLTNGNEEPLIDENASVAEEMPVADIVVVDVGGAVKNPTVVTLNDGSRVEDAIEAAGGLTDDADLTDINRAAFVNDGDKIFVPSKGLDGAISNVLPPGSGSGVSADGKVNINTADSQQLQTLTGVGPATADKIISYRESNGRFTAIEDIMKVSGIGDKTYEKLKDSIRV